MPRSSIFAAVGLAASAACAAISAQEAVPPELSALVSTARIAEPVVAWCAGTFQSGHRGAYAIAVGSSQQGRYLVIERDGSLFELGTFDEGAKVECFTAAAARRHSAAIQRMEAVQGKIVPRWRTDVVCGFRDVSNIFCWQFSSAERKFVSVGGWVV